VPFVKLDCGILDSSLWLDHAARELFITALLMAEPRELTEPAPQIAVDNLAPTGWIVPAGWYGFVRASGSAIVRRSGLPLSPADGLAALARLGNPEDDSRSADYDGRRLVRVDGGYVVLNFVKYREKDSTHAERQRRWRERQRRPPADSDGVTVTPGHRHVTEAEVEAEVVRTTVPRAREDAGTEPAPERPPVSSAVIDRASQTIAAGTLPRDHLRCLGPCGRVCLPIQLARQFARQLGGDPTTALDRVRAFRDQVLAEIPDDQPIGDDPWVFWRRWFAARVESAGPITGAERVEAERVRKANFGRCPHSPRCDSAAACVEAIALDIRSRRA
jgi:hypothetical protein